MFKDVLKEIIECFPLGQLTRMNDDFGFFIQGCHQKQGVERTPKWE
jgi:hypothetical protein